MRHCALCSKRQAAADVAVQIGLGQRAQPRRMLGRQGRGAQPLDLRGRQAIEAAPVFMAFAGRHAGQKIAQQLAALALALAQRAVQRVAAWRQGPGQHVALCGGRLRQRQGKVPAGNGAAVHLQVQQFAALAGAGHQRRDGAGNLRGQGGAEQGGLAGTLGLAARQQGGVQRVWPHHVQPCMCAKQRARGLQVGAHGLAPAGQRQQQLPFGAHALAGQQGNAQRQLADVVALGLAGKLVGAGRRPDAQRHGRSQRLPPGAQPAQAGLRLRAFGRANPQLIGCAQAVLLAQRIERRALRVVRVQIDDGRGQPAEDFRDDGPTGAKRAQQNVVVDRWRRRMGQRCHGMATGAEGGAAWANRWPAASRLQSS